MKMSLPKLHLVAWINIASILAMLWSGTMHARAGGIKGAQAWNDICSVAGAPEGATKTPPGSSDTPSHVTHCVFCSKQDIAHVLPSHLDLPQPIAHISRTQPPRELTHRLPQPWLNRRSRAPPVSMS